MHRPAPLRLAALLTLAGVLAACGSSQTASPTAAPGAPARGGTMTIALPAEVANLDPQSTTSLIPQRLREQIYDSLVTLDFDRRTILPDLATQWQVSQDGKTYTFQLRKDVKFQSGKALTSSDVKFTFDRWLAKETKSPTVWLIGDLASVDAPDPATVVFHLKEPSPDFLLNIGRSEASILNADFVRQAGSKYGTSAATVDGTGPFKVTEWVVNDHVTLSRNPDYRWGPKDYANPGPAYLDKIVWKSMPEASAQVLALETGAVDAIPPRVQFSALPRLKQDKNVQLPTFGVGSTVIIGFTLDRPPMDDKVVRQAISHALDTKSVIDKVMNGAAVPACGLVAPGVEASWQDCKAPAFDPAQAKQLLDQDGWAMGADGYRHKDGKLLELTANIYQLNPYPEAYTVFQANLKDVGVKLNVDAEQSAKIFAMYDKGTQGMWSTSIPNDTPYQGVYNFLGSWAIPSPNRFHFKNPQVDQWVKEASTSMDAGKRDQDYLNAQKAALDDAIYVPFFYEQGLVAVATRVHGFKPYGYVNDVFDKMLDTWVSPK